MQLLFDTVWIQGVALTSLRLAAFIIIAPPFSTRAFPAVVKAMLSIGLAIALSPLLAPSFTVLDTGPFVVEAAAQLGIGFALGLLVFIIFSAIPSAGDLVDVFGGFQLAQGFDPMMNINGAMFARLFQMTALALLFASGGYQIVILGIARSFTAVPLGSFLNWNTTIEAMIAAVGQMFAASVQIAGPLLIVLFLADLGLGLMTKVAPALNAYSLSFPIKILLTLTLGGIVFAVLPSTVEGLLKTITDTLMGVSHG